MTGSGAVIGTSLLVETGEDGPGALLSALDGDERRRVEGRALPHRWRRA